jgi:hypothetical protein
MVKDLMAVRNIIVKVVSATELLVRITITATREKMKFSRLTKRELVSEG